MRTWPTFVAAAAVTFSVAALMAPAQARNAPAARVPAELRVDQAGYASGAAKVAYRRYGGSAAYSAFAGRQLGYALGANLSGSLTGTGAIQLGATVDGPSSPDNFTGLGTVPGMRACGHGAYGPSNNPAAGYEDNVVSWPSVEPADDYTAISLLAFAYGARGLG